MKLGVISDTHGVLREEVVERLQECDYIIHAGDIGNKDIIDKLESITKTFVVRGIMMTMSGVLLFQNIEK